MADKKTETKAATGAVKEAAAAITRAVQDDANADRTSIATADAEEAMRKEATSASARKEALAAGKKDPYLKWGDPKAAEEDAEGIAARRTAFGGV